MIMPTTRILISKDGKIVVEGIDYVGDACIKDLSRLLEALKKYGINVKIEIQQKKPEAYVSTAQAVAANAF